MPPKRRTANIRIFERKLHVELHDCGLGNRPWDEIQLTTWTQMLNAVTRTMFDDTSNVQFYNNSGDGTRVLVTDPEQRGAKLIRFLKRTIPAHIPHLENVLITQQAGGCPWIQSITGAEAPPGAPDELPDGDGDEGKGEGGNPDGRGDAGAPGGADGREAEGEPEDAQPEPDPNTMTLEQREVYEEQQLDKQPNDSEHADEFAKWWKILAKLRKYCREAAEHGLPIDDLDSYRPAIMGAAMIREGITADACADAATAHWPNDARTELEISKVAPESVIAPPDGHHPALGYLIALLRARVPVLLHGGAGVGKTTLARQVAELYGLPFGMVSMTSGLSTTALTGSVNLQGFVTRPCIDTFSNGGVFLFDEMDAADPNLLLVCNTMLANGEFQSPVTGERHLKHERWYPMAAVNTLNGATTAYTGRSRLDQATMDRWRMGRVRVDFDIKLGLKYALDMLNQS